MKTDKFIDPKSDYAFKKIFGSVSNKELTIGFLSSLLEKDIRNITYHNVEMQGDIASEKFKKATPEEKRRWNYNINKVYVVCFLDYVMEGMLAGMRQVAANMKRKGIDIAAIVDCTGLNADVILSL